MCLGLTEQSYIFIPTLATKYTNVLLFTPLDFGKVTQQDLYSQSGKQAITNFLSFRSNGSKTQPVEEIIPQYWNEASTLKNHGGRQPVLRPSYPE